MRPSLLFDLLDREYEASAAGRHVPVMLWGPPGVGKSEIVHALAARHSVPVVDLRLSQLEPTDLRGIPFREGERVDWSIPAMLPDAHRHGPRGVLFLDEINAAPPTVTAAAYQLILDRRLGDYRVPTGWAIFAAGNRQGDRGVTYAMPAPLANRFTHYEVEAHLEDWIAWAHDADLAPSLIAFLRFRPELLFDFDPSRNPLAFPSPRTWFYADRALAKFRDAPALLIEGLAACVGRAAAAELVAFLDHMEHLPDVEAIVRGDPQPVPEAIDLQYGIAPALVRRARRARQSPDAMHIAGNILRYAAQFPQREMGVMLVTDLQRAYDRPLIDIPEFIAWADGVSHLVRPSPGREDAPGREAVTGREEAPPAPPPVERIPWRVRTRSRN
ncbi:MAG: AAA family ATPase [Burkholderiales bacterium]|nr:AAA family ATPase [Burkholderiales bacterium]